LKYRDFGKTGFQASALGFGVMRLPSMKNPLDPRVDEKEAIRMIRRAIDLGVNYIDTAWPYHLGNSEKILGKALQDGYREKVFLVTKLPMFRVSRKEDFDKYFQVQLERLQTGYVDAYLFHGLNAGNFKKVESLNLIEDMERERTAGRIRNIGFSFHDTLPVFKRIIDSYDWDMTMIQYNYLDTTNQAGEEGLRYAHEKGIAVTVMEPLKGGMLAHPPKEARKILNGAPIKRTPVDWALQYLWNLPEVAVVLSGMSSLEQLEQNLKSAEGSGVGSLTEEENRAIDSIIDIYREKILVPCTACQYCMPCPAGVNIPENFALANTANQIALGPLNWVMKLGARSKYRKLADTKAKLNPKVLNGRATLCIDCGQCVPLCPQSIAIPEDLKKVQQFLGKNRNPKKVFQGLEGRR